MTKLVIFGASGRTGIPLVQQALDAGHDVVAFVRSPQKLPVQHARLTVVQGDVMNPDDVDRAITADVDAVISALSPVKGSPSDMLSQAADNILAAMHRHGIKRLIYMTGAGVPSVEDRPQLLDHGIKFLLKTLAGDVLKQSEEAVNRVRHSKLDWTVVRAPMLTDGPATGNIRVGWIGVNTGPHLARGDAAAFLLQQVNSREFVGKAPVISN